MEGMKNPKSQTPQTLPEHLIFDHIVPRLPVKSILRFKCVSKDWLSTLSTREFALFHLELSSPPSQFIIVTELRYLFLLSYKPTISVHELLPSHFNHGTPSLRLVGSCHGLVCLYLSFHDVFILWNPGTREFREIDCPGDLCDADAYGFGYASSIDDYKIAVFGHLSSANDGHGDDNDEENACFYVFSFRDTEWRRIPYPDGEYLMLNEAAVVIDESFFWTGHGLITFPIVEFNLVTEQLEKKTMMPWLREYWWADLFHIQGRLALRCGKKSCHPSDFWLLEEHDDWKSWRKLFSVNLGGHIYFSEEGMCLVQCSEDRFELVELDQGALEDVLLEVDTGFTMLDAREYEESLISPFNLTEYDEKEEIQPS